MPFVKGYKQTEEHKEKLRLARIKTHCKYGHEFSLENTHINPQGERVCKVCRYNNNRAVFLKKTKEEKLDTRNKKLVYTYGINSEDYSKMFQNQEGKCLICNVHYTELSKGLFIDHNHTTNAVRGLLCTNCNSMIGLADEDISILEKAIEYVEEKK